MSTITTTGSNTITAPDTPRSTTEKGRKKKNTDNLTSANLDDEHHVPTSSGLPSSSNEDYTSEVDEEEDSDILAAGGSTYGGRYVYNQQNFTYEINIIRNNFIRYISRKLTLT